MFFRSNKVAALSLLGIAALALGSARETKANPANVELLSVVQSGSLFQFNYALDLAPTEALTSGDFFTVYDFNGFAGFSSPAFTTDRGGTLTASSSLVGPNAPRTAPTEDAAIPNVTFTYSGADILGGRVTGFSALSTSGGTTPGTFTALTEDRSGPNQGDISSIGPVLRPAAAQPIPEPGSLALAGMGLLGAVGMLCRRKKSA
jgi:hypothetical protein